MYLIGKSSALIEKKRINGSFAIAVLNNQRVMVKNTMFYTKDCDGLGVVEENLL